MFIIPRSLEITFKLCEYKGLKIGFSIEETILVVYDAILEAFRIKKKSDFNSEDSSVF